MNSPLSPTAQKTLAALIGGKTLTSYGESPDHAQNVIEATPGAMIAGIQQDVGNRYLFGVQPAIMRRLIAEGYIVEDRRTTYTYTIPGTDRQYTTVAIHWRHAAP